MDPLVIQAPLIAHPAGIDRIVVARLIPVDLVFPGADSDVAAGRTGGADGLGFLHEPDAHLEPEIFRSQGAHRAKVNGVERVIIVEAFTGVGCDGVVASSIDDTQGVISSHISTESNASCAENAPLIIQHDAGAQIDLLGLADFGLHELTLGLAMFNRILLQLAFARLIADRAIQRVVDEKGFQHRLAHHLGVVRVGINFHVGRHRSGTGDGTSGQGGIVW